MNTSTSIKFQAAVRAHLAKCKASAKIKSRDGEESLSFLKDTLYSKGWRGLGNTSHFEDLLEEHGFTLRRDRGKNGNILRTYVSETCIDNSKAFLQAINAEVQS